MNFVTIGKCAVVAALGSVVEAGRHHHRPWPQPGLPPEPGMQPGMPMPPGMVGPEHHHHHHRGPHPWPHPGMPQPGMPMPPHPGMMPGAATPGLAPVAGQAPDVAVDFGEIVEAIGFEPGDEVTEDSDVSSFTDYGTGTVVTTESDSWDVEGANRTATISAEVTTTTPVNGTGSR